MDQYQDRFCYIGLYELLGKLEEGAQSSVYLGWRDGKHYGIKIYKKHLEEETFRRQSQMLEKITHQYWVKPIYCFANVKCRIPSVPFGEASCLIMDYYKNGDLRKYFSLAPFPLPLCRRVLLSLLLGLEHAQAQGIIHRDIKPENILVSENYEFKLMDLGLAIHVDEDPQGCIVGTKPFLAPQILKSKKYSFGSDLFAVGVLFFMLATARYPFREAKITDPQYFLFMQGNDNKFWEKLQSRDQEPFAPSFRRLLQALLNPRSEKRPTISEILDFDEMQEEIATQEETEFFFRKHTSSKE